MHLVSGLVAVGAAACATPPAFDCPQAVAAKHPTAAMLCLAQFQTTGDRATGALSARALEDLRIENDLIGLIAERVGDSPEGADAWNALGDVHRHARRNEQSIASYRRALAHRSPKDLKGRIHDAAGLYNRYDDHGNFIRAMEYIGIAYELAHELGDRRELGYVLPGIISIVLDLGGLPLAQELADESARFVDEHDENWLFVLENRAAVDFAQGRYRVAAIERQRAIDLARSRGNLDHWIRRESLALAWTQLYGGDFAAARSTLDGITIDAADPWADEDGTRKALTLALIAIGLRHYDEAIAIIERVDRAPDVWQIQLDAARGRALARMGRLTEAEAVLGRVVSHVDEHRADFVLDSLKPWRLAALREPFEDLFDVLVAERRFAEALVVVQEATARSMFEGLVSAPTTRGRTLPERFALEGERADALRALLGSLRISRKAKLPTADELVTRLAGHTVLTYFCAGAAVWLLALNDGVVTATRITDVATLRDAIASQADLGPLLLPAGVLPPPGQTLYIALDDALQHVAFAALRVDHAFLVERNPIAYVPSASVLAAEVGRESPRTRVVVVGDPEANLPGARSEATEVAGSLGVDPILGRSATRQAVLDAGDAALLHVASHAQIGARGAALRLADGPLTAGDVVDAPQVPDVVVLTSCNSASTVYRDELGPLANAYIAAGARAVVASRWAVPDQAALQFSRAFYSSGGARDPIGGVARAQRKLIAAGVPAETWSMFVVIGTHVSPINKED